MGVGAPMFFLQAFLVAWMGGSTWPFGSLPDFVFQSGKMAQKRHLFKDLMT